MERFWNKVNKDAPGDCWEWTAAKHKKGYGHIKVAGFVWRAHRLSYKMAHGEFDQSLNVCHTCDNPACVNPDHLWLGTQKDNVEDMVSKGRVQRWHSEKTHCPHGHEYTEQNTSNFRDNERTCRTCHRKRSREYYHRKKAIDKTSQETTI